MFPLELETQSDVAFAQGTGDPALHLLAATKPPFPVDLASELTELIPCSTGQPFVLRYNRYSLTCVQTLRLACDQGDVQILLFHVALESVLEGLRWRGGLVCQPPSDTTGSMESYLFNEERDTLSTLLDTIMIVPAELRGPYSLTIAKAEPEAVEERGTLAPPQTPRLAAHSLWNCETLKNQKRDPYGSEAIINLVPASNGCCDPAPDIHSCSKSFKYDI